MSLKGAAQETVLELTAAEINSDDGVDLVIKKLDKLYTKDATLEKFETLEAFDSFQRKPETSIQEHIHEFEKIYNKLKDKGTTMSDDLLAYKLLKSVQLLQQDKKIVKGTTTDLTLENMKIQLKKIFPDSGIRKPADELLPNEINEVQSQPPSETFYNSGGRGSYRGYQGTLYQPRRPPNPPPVHFTRNNRYSNPRGRQYVPSPRFYRQPSPARNPVNPNTGAVTRCNFCNSPNHWERECPQLLHQRPSPSINTNNVYVEQTYPPPQQQHQFTAPQPLLPPPEYPQQELQQPQPNDPSANHYFVDNEPTNEAFYQIILFQKREDSKKVKGLVAESFNSAVLDSAASKTVCGRKWFQVFEESLPDSMSIPTQPSNAGYKFGDSDLVVATERAVIPATLGNKNIYISTDIVEEDVPFLLSREAMKKMQMIINFGTDSASFLGITYPLTITSSGHYTIPLTPSMQLLSTVKCIPDSQVVFTVTAALTKFQQAVKLHRQFAHAPADKIIALLNTAGKPWSSDSELKSELSHVVEKCQTCLEYGKELPKPSVALPSANHFQETVALDLKFYDVKILLHLIDHATRYSACAIIPNKRPQQVVKAMFSHWIGIFGAPNKFLSDNGSEFINQELLDLCETYNVTLKTTGAEAPWSNGLIERHNQVLGNMLDRVLNDVNCNFEIALLWCVNAKNSLQNVHGFLPYQLVFGHNPALPGPFNNRPPALEDIESRGSEIVRANLNAQQSARVAFMESERSERLRRALRTNTRTYSDQVIINNDKVYYKRNNSKKWKGPAFVLGRDGQQILLKHGGFYIRVHPCRVRLAREPMTNNNFEVPATTTPNTLSTNSTTTLPTVLSKNVQQDEESSDSESGADEDKNQDNRHPEHPSVTNNSPTTPPSQSVQSSTLKPRVTLPASPVQTPLPQNQISAMPPASIPPSTRQKPTPPTSTNIQQPRLTPTPPRASNLRQPTQYVRRRVQLPDNKTVQNYSANVKLVGQLTKGDRLLVKLPT